MKRLLILAGLVCLVALVPGIANAGCHRLSCTSKNCSSSNPPCSDSVLVCACQAWEGPRVCEDFCSQIPCCSTSFGNACLTDFCTSSPAAQRPGEQPVIIQVATCQGEYLAVIPPVGRPE